MARACVQLRSKVGPRLRVRRRSRVERVRYPVHSDVPLQTRPRGDATTCTDASLNDSERTNRLIGPDVDRVSSKLHFERTHLPRTVVARQANSLARAPFFCSAVLLDVSRAANVRRPNRCGIVSMAASRRSCVTSTTAARRARRSNRFIIQ